jgi:homoserine dehydrogenase
MDDVFVEGIRGISKVDLDYALELGYRIKLLAIIKRDGEKMEARVHPTLVSLDNMLASVNGVFNAVMVNSDLADCGMYYGRGAGRMPTASTVLGDICDIARNLAVGTPHRIPAIPGAGKAVEFKSISEIVSRYYLRLSIVDEPGVLSRLTDILATHEISVESAMEKGSVTDGHVTAVIVTHETRETEIDVAVAGIEALDVVQGEVIRIRAL